MHRHDDCMRGEVNWRREPEWAPLLEAAGEEITGDFMWMHEVELDDGQTLQAYKHIDTRRYVHLGDDGAAFEYTDSGLYRQIDAATGFATAFATLAGLGGVSEAQVAASWRVVEARSRARLATADD